ncbi:MAG: hypothetical protein COT74_13785 [Bdellovibrionales bacterium CG10_big_fil_rev_8_21_14_0_10_45_34]|nr:MAG: hypothetical protein COT74_13785 [Bdellovibrionales bacterium CG10_big_fil_rev_8_21_14_0_10_45_34]
MIKGFGSFGFAEISCLCCAFLLATQLSLANPFPDSEKVPRDENLHHVDGFPIGLSLLRSSNDKRLKAAGGKSVIRIDIAWSADESYQIEKVSIDKSGTSALYNRSTTTPKQGSYVGVLRDANTNVALAYDSIGTGRRYRKLARSIAFRFPNPNKSVILELIAENPLSGKMEQVLRQRVDVDSTESEEVQFEHILLKEASHAQKLEVVIYAEGYKAGTKDKFWRDAQRVIQALTGSDFPGLDRMQISAVFSESKLALGQPPSRPSPEVKERDSFLGLYYPHWDQFGRWYHVVYPTNEKKFRRRLALVPYDYPIVLINSSDYWGVGNYMSHTAVPSDSSQFSYLLRHELGHFFGLNEEYQDGGPTELEFAPDIYEPWSQNITFLRSPLLGLLKWKAVVSPSTPLPTPSRYWSRGVFGAYRGGYAESEVAGAHSHKPGLDCTMDRGRTFCEVCRHAIEEVIADDIGPANLKPRISSSF